VTDSNRLAVLVVDDDRSVLAVLQSWLSRQGWIPECHDDPVRALEAYALRKHAAVVLDWHMPGMDGIDILRRLRADNQSHAAYVLLVTSSDRDDLLRTAFENGVDDFLRKPLHKTEFNARMKAARRVCQLDREIRQRSEHDLERRMHTLALERVSALVGAIAHEIRTPLGSVRMASERLQMKKERFPEDLRHIVDRVVESSSLLAETLDDVLETFGASGRKAKWESFSPTESVTQAVGLLKDRAKPGVALTLEIEESAGATRGKGEAASIRRLAANLLANALRHTESGSVKVVLRSLPTGVELVVEDTGGGIPPEMLPWLGEALLLNSENGGFGKYVRGNGMGLALCRKVVQRHGGIFAVHSELGIGTRIAATLRLDMDAPMPTTGPDQFYTSAGPLPVR
jgi:signal transduction histidine kinase